MRVEPIKKAVLLINIGTPDNCDSSSVKKYLKEFLSDRRMIDLPQSLRFLLVNFFILPFRTKKTAAAYQKIWSSSGSPLSWHTNCLKEALAEELGSDYQIEIGMRYGEPSIPLALSQFKNIQTLTVIPLFPQYSSAATGSAIETLMTSLKRWWNIPELKIKYDFYHHAGFIKAYADRIQQSILNDPFDLLLFSYHGLPERHINKSDCHASCDRLYSCPPVENTNLYCYRAQCFLTSHLIAKKLNLTSDQYKVSFQSRLGRTPWIKPYTDQLLSELIQKGIKNIAMVSPSFVADCLETLEEINIRTRESWKKLGGKEFIFVPSLNDSPLWVKALSDIIQNK